MSKEISSNQLVVSGININRSSFFLYILLIPSLIAYHAFDRAKLIYFIPVIMLALFLFENLFTTKKEKGLRFEPNMVFSLILYLTLMLVGLLLNYESINYKAFIRDILIILSPIIVFVMKMSFNENHIKWLFIASVISYFAWVGIDLEFDWSFNFVRSNYNMSSEFHNGVILGCFFLFFIYRKMFLWAIPAALLILMSGKRSIILGIVPAMATYYLLINPLNIDKNKYLLALILAIYFFIFYAIGSNLDTFAKWFLEMIGMDSQDSLNRFLMGREVFISYLKTHIDQSELLQYLFGYGPGQADVFTHDIIRPDWGAEKREFVNPHNDILKIRFDYGLIGSLSLFILFYSSYIRTKMGIQIFLYSIPLLLVDNSFIFIYYWFIALTVARFEDSEPQSIKT
ncbi:O-antigen ligase family protein [Hyphobacterium sp. CCMP332]|nr:O-antigen ligase family protein [Hyphobacterium sp. CCMP332]